MEDADRPANRTFKVLALQYKPVYKDIKASMLIADGLVNSFTEDDKIDAVILPEMAFTGYTFDSKDDIRPYLEKAGEGDTFEWCSALAIKLKSYIFCGYPEQDGDKMFNSQLVVDREGKFVKSYKKAYLYTTDEVWADEGPGFDTMEIINHQGKSVKIGHGI